MRFWFDTERRTREQRGTLRVLTLTSRWNIEQPTRTNRVCGLLARACARLRARRLERWFARRAGIIYATRAELEGAKRAAKEIAEEIDREILEKLNNADYTEVFGPSVRVDDP